METIEQRVKKSSLHANSEFDYKRLAFGQQYLLPCKIEEEEEELVFFYDVTGMTPLLEIRGEDTVRKAAVLLEAHHLASLLGAYSISLDPSNLYCDVNNQVKVKSRDIANGREQQVIFLKEYKALIGFLSQSKYSFLDFMQGGESLLTKQPFLEKVYQAETIEDTCQVIKEEYERLLTIKKETKIEIKKTSYHSLKIATSILGVVCGISVIYSAYSLFFDMPYKNAVIKADQAFLEKDYVSVIDKLSDYGIQKFDKTQKYELAYAYINGEDLDSESKSALLSKLSIKDSEERMEYWINLGRDEVDEAVNSAIKQSDDALLVIAYNKKLVLIKEDTSLTAEEKNTQTQNVEQQLKTLQEKYSETDTDSENTLTENQPVVEQQPQATATPTPSAGTSIKDSKKDVLNQ